MIMKKGVGHLSFVLPGTTARAGEDETLTVVGGGSPRHKAWHAAVNAIAATNETANPDTVTPLAPNTLDDTRYWRCATQLAGNYIDHLHGELGDNWWKKMGFWAVDTINGNSWGSAKIPLSKSAADFCLMQELKIFDPSKLRSAHGEARHRKWNLAPTLALRTAADKASGGCAVAARIGFGLKDNSDTLVPKAYRHRIAVSWVGGIIKGGCHLVSILAQAHRGHRPRITRRSSRSLLKYLRPSRGPG